MNIPEFLVCPCCKGRLLPSKKETEKSPSELICLACGLGFAIRDGIPMMVPHDARELTAEEVESRRAAEKHTGQPQAL